MIETEQLLQPHEGVAGAHRAGDPVCTSQEATDLVATLARHLYQLSLSGIPNATSTFLRMTTPQPGDRVVVLDSVGRDEDTRWKGVGYLLTVRREWATSDEQWEREQAEAPTAVANGYLERLVEPEACYVQYGPAPVDVCRWVNCRVLAIPEPGDAWWRP